MAVCSTWFQPWLHSFGVLAPAGFYAESDEFCRSEMHLFKSMWSHSACPALPSRVHPEAGLFDVVWGGVLPRKRLLASAPDSSGWSHFLIRMLPLVTPVCFGVAVPIIGVLLISIESVLGSTIDWERLTRTAWICPSIILVHLHRFAASMRVFPLLCGVQEILSAMSFKIDVGHADEPCLASCHSLLPFAPTV